MIRTPTQICQLAADWRGKVLEDGMMAEQKVDGWRCLYFKGIDDVPRLWTRNGHPIEGADHVLHHMTLLEAAAGFDIFVDGEIQVDGTLAATKEWFETVYKLGGEKGVYHAFDMMPLREWKCGGSDVQLVTRKAALETFLDRVENSVSLSWEWREGSRGRGHGISPVKIIPDIWISDAADVLDAARRAWAMGWEGLMLKDAMAPYRRERNATWQKVKKDGPWLKAL